MNEIRRATTTALIAQLKGAESSLASLWAGEFSAHTNLPDAIEFSEHGATTRHALNAIKAASASLADAIIQLERALAR